MWEKVKGCEHFRKAAYKSIHGKEIKCFKCVCFVFLLVPYGFEV